MTNEQIDVLTELPAGVTPESNDPEVIYMEPTCCADPAWGKSWTADVDCFDCMEGIAPTKYIRVDLVRELAEEVKRLRAAMRNIQRVVEIQGSNEATCARIATFAKEVLDDEATQGLAR